MFDINDRNKMFAYVPSKLDLTVDNINLYSNSLIFIGDENQIYQPLTNTYIGIGRTAYNNLLNDYMSKIDKLYIYGSSNSDNIHYFPILKTDGTRSFYYTYLSNRIGVNPDKQLFIGNISGTSYTSSYSYIYSNSNDENLPLIFADITDNINNTIYKDSENSIFYNPFKNSFGHGNNVVASGNYSTAEGINNIADGIGSHVEGSDNMAYGDYSHVEGSNNIAYGDYSHIGGSQSISYSESSFVHGTGLLTGSYSNVIVFGQWNDASNDDSVFIIGNGTDNQNRSNLFEIRENGCAYADTFVGNLNGRARWADYATYSTYTTYTTYALYNSYQSVHEISLDKNYYITFSENSTYSLSYIDTDFYYNPLTNVLNSSYFSGNLTGDVVGNVTGDVVGNLTGDVVGNLTGDVIGNLTGYVTGDVSGNAGTATKLAYSRYFNGVAFDGTANVEMNSYIWVEGNDIAIQVGYNRSSNVTVPYATNSNLAAMATKLETARNINGVSFDGSVPINIIPSLPVKDNTIAVKVGDQQSSYITVPYATNSNIAAEAVKLQTPRYFNGVAFDGTANVEMNSYIWVEGNDIAIQVGYNRSSNVTVPYATNSNLAAMATKLETARNINGVSFDGTGDINVDPLLVINGNTIASKVGTRQSSYITVPYATNSGNASTADKWKTARILTIGSASQSVDGHENVTWTLDEIGVYDKTTADDRYVNVTGDTMTGHLKLGGTKDLGSSWDKGVIAGADGHTKVVLTYLASVTNGAVIGAHNSNLTEWDILNIAGTQLIFRISETEKMRLNASGHLGIGTSSPSYPLHVNGNTFASGFIKSGSDVNHVLTGDGGHKEWSISSTASTLVARDASNNIYVNDINTTADDMNSTAFTKVYVSDNNWIKSVSKSKFVEGITAYDTITMTKSLTVTEAWMDTGIVVNNTTFPLGSGTYAIQISHSTLNSGTDGYASIYSGIISIYTDGTNSTTDSEEVILHRAGHAWANRLYIRTMPVASSGNCKIQIAASKTWSAAANITFTFRKLI